MKNSLILALLVFAVFSQCKKDDNPKPVGEQIETGDVIIEENVSSAGTTLVSDKFSLEITAGTFSTSTAMKISKLENTPFSTDALTPVYFLNDLPPGTAEPMIIRIAGLDLSANPTAFLAEITRVHSADTNKISYRKIEYEVEDGKVKVIIPRTPSIYIKSGNITDEKLTIGVVVAKSQQTIVSSNGHFQLTSPVSKLAKAAEIADYLEEAYSLFNNAPFSFDYSARTVWPMGVTLLPMDNSLFGEQVSSVWGDNYATLSFNSDKLNEMSEMRITAGHEFFHFVQSLYDPRSGFMKAKFASSHYWLDEAMSVWAEEFFSGSTGYSSPIRVGNEPAPYEGGLNETKSDVRGYGYGMSGMIKYIADHFGINSMKAIYEQIHLEESPAEAIRLGLDKYYNSWYGLMLQEYTKSAIYPDVSTGLLVGLKSGEFNVNNENDTVMKFEASYKQLASNIYTVSIKESAVTDLSTLSVVADQQSDQMINIYKIKSATIPPELVGSGSASVAVADIKILAADGYKFLVVLTNLTYNSNNAASSLSFTARISKKQTYKTFSFDLNVMCHYTYHYESGNPSTVDGAWHSAGFIELPLTQNGNILTASWNGIYGYPSSGNATITLNEDGTVTAEIHQLDLDLIASHQIMDCVITSLPLTSDNWSATTYYSDISYPYIQSLYWKETYSNFYIECDGFFTDPQYGNKNVMLRLFK